MCTLKFSLPPSVRYVSFGVDPDQECNGNLTDSEWVIENNTLICQYKNGVKKRVFLEGGADPFYKRHRKLRRHMDSGRQQEGDETLDLQNTSVIIEYPVSGEFLFEMVTHNGTRYTMARF